MSSKLQCLLVLTWFLSMVCKHVRRINREQRRHVDVEGRALCGDHDGLEQVAMVLRELS